ncbi:MAG: hypothetical protein FRX48_05377 [Lasallia pustulata]|uniref:Uncharacterized protein n=1 Tax=Lasallia pustulata TaxID=136370 RepID=A0A5M8PR72_9LECA|nr:MAG: hypothetical protein FRX48_05377 [Lasallia pustulata]
MAAVYGCFTHTLLISSFNALFALLVKRTFSWTSTGAGLIFLAISIPSTLDTIIGALSDRYDSLVGSPFGFELTVPALALTGVVTDGSVGHQAALIILLVAVGIGLNFIFAPFAADMFDEVEALSLQHPETFGKKRAYAQAYSLFGAALGLATVVGPGWSGLFFEKTSWQITAGILAVICAVGGVPVFCYTGWGVKREGKEGTGASAAQA